MSQSNSRRRTLLVAPSTIALVGLFLVPVAYFFIVSFWRVRSYRLKPEWNVEQYVAVITDYHGPLGFTMLVAVIIALATTSFAYAYAYVCRFRAGRWATVLLFVPLITLFGGYLTKIYVWKTILGSTGILNSSLMALGIIDEPITAFLFNPFAVVITLTHYTLPLAILPIYGSLRSIKDAPLQAARDLGANKRRVFLDIVLPQSKIGLVSAFSLTFLFAAGDYVTPQLVGGPHTSMIGLFIQSQFGHRLNAPLGSAMSFTVILCCLLVIAVFAITVHRSTRPR